MQQIGPKDEKEAEALWKWLLAENTLFHSRMTVFLATQALLFAGVAGIYKADNSSKLLLFVIALVGLAMAFLWTLAMQRQTAGTINPIKSVLMAFGEKQPEGTFSREYYRIARSRAQSILPGLDLLVGLFVPLIFMIAWCAVAIFAFCHN